MPAIWLTREQAAERASVKPDTVSEWCRRKGLRYARVSGRIIRIKESWLDEFLESHEVNAASFSPNKDLNSRVDRALADF